MGRCMYNILIDNKVVGQTPKHLGVNVEVQDHHDRCNLWDWLADSGATLLREFHPEKNLRREAAKEADYAAIDSRQTFDVWRLTMLADPEKNIPWDNYLFSEKVTWLGVPDGIVEKLKTSELDAVLSMGYATKTFPRPLVLKWEIDNPVGIENIDWGAAACAYEYYFAMCYRYSSRYGITHYMLHNEPENHPERFHLPPGGGSPDEVDVRKISAIASQLGVLAYLAKLALEDTRVILSEREVANRLILSGPAAHWHWEVFALAMHSHLDILDYHHYGPHSETFRRTYSRLAMRARQYRRKTAISEFNILSGPITPADMLFNIDPAMNLAALLMTIISATHPDDSGCEFATLYQFQFPATHRNYKSLVYGDMNRVDWTGRDTTWMNLENPDIYPSFEELQLRHPTLGYHVFRMLARCVPGNRENRDSFSILDWGCSIDSAESQTEIIAVQQDEQLIVNLLNKSRNVLKGVTLDLEMLPQKYAFAVVRETSVKNRDAAVSQQYLGGKRIVLDLPLQSLTQVVFTPLELDKLSSLRLEENSFTPGTAQNLGLLQTTRLRAIGKIGETEIDLTNLNVVWTSSHPDSFPVYQGGLLQRLRQSTREVTVTARTLNGIAAPSIVINQV